MGGGGEHHHVEGAHGHGGGDFRSKVWSMTGGANCRPKHWKRNTAFAMCGIVLICIPIAMKSAQLEATKGLNFCVYLMWCWEHHWRKYGRGTYRNTQRKCHDTSNCGQRPHLPVRPIPSQIWCKNFGNKDY